jgi:hypothetical protein
MIQLSEIKPGARLSGVISNEIIEVIAATPFGDDAIDLVYRSVSGRLGQQMLYANMLEPISIETRDLHWKFDADAETVRLASEAYRIKLAHLFDPHLAVHTMRFIEVKGRQAGVGMVTVTHNEMVIAANKPENAYLAVVEVDGNKRHVTYFLHWNKQTPGFAVVNNTIQLDKLRKTADVVYEKEIVL